MARAIVALLRDEPRRRRLGQAGLARVTERFTVERMVEQTASVYARVAGKGHAAGTGNPGSRFRRTPAVPG
jgi:glycosyltransferase involved in cell wall biosynthesis